MIYGEKYSFLSLFTKALPTDGPTDRRTDGPTDGRTDIPSYRDAWTHLKTDHEYAIKAENPRFHKEKNVFG